MKKFYRFLRGELNGYYIQNINNALNSLTENIQDFFTEFHSLVFKLSENVTSSETAITSTRLKGIGRFIGFLPPYSYVDVLPQALHFTNSYYVSGTQYSERGLYNVDSENFSFNRTNESEYKTDINTLATSTTRTSLVEAGASILGYFVEDETVIQEDGSLDLTKLHSVAPDDKAYSAYYGDQYLIFNEDVTVFRETPTALYYEILCILQQIRYNRPSIKTLCDLATALCPSYLIFDSYEWKDKYGELSYHLDDNVALDNKIARLTAFKLIVNLKFNQIALNESTTD